MTTPYEPPAPPARPTPARPGRKLGPIADSVGSAHRAWLEPVRETYLKSGLTLSELSVRVRLAKSKISELLRGTGLYPRWEIILSLSTELNMPQWPLYRGCVHGSGVRVRPDPGVCSGVGMRPA